MSSERPSKRTKSRSVESMRLMSGMLCLDFLNTRAFRPGVPREWLNTYADVLTFTKRTEMLPQAQQDHLLELASASPEAAQAVVQHAQQWREALYKIVRQENSALDLELFNAVLADAFAHRRVSGTGVAYTWEWQTSLEVPLWIIALNAAELLVSGAVGRVHFCPGHDCGWVFLDNNRGKPRRWCAMDLCGNRAKIKRFRGQV